MRASIMADAIIPEPMKPTDNFMACRSIIAMDGSRKYVVNMDTNAIQSFL
jgi:hypothetical protein